MNPLLALAAKWRSDANVVEQRGAPGIAEVWRLAADELDVFLSAWETEKLALTQAAQESGYTRSALEKMLRRGDIANAGEKGKPRIRRCDLPKKAGGTLRDEEGEPDLAAAVWAAKQGA